MRDKIRMRTGRGRDGEGRTHRHECDVSAEKLVEGGCEEEAVADVVYGGYDVLLAAAAPAGGERPDCWNADFGQASACSPAVPEVRYDARL